MTFTTIAEVYTVTKFELEKECIYLMKKRKVLEDVIIERENTIIELTNGIEIRDKMLEQGTIQTSNHQGITQQVLERLNREKDELARRIQQLEKENVELKERVGND